MEGSDSKKTDIFNLNSCSGGVFLFDCKEKGRAALRGPAILQRVKDHRKMLIAEGNAYATMSEEEAYKATRYSKQELPAGLERWHQESELISRLARTAFVGCFEKEELKESVFSEQMDRLIYDIIGKQAFMCRLQYRSVKA